MSELITKKVNSNQAIIMIIIAILIIIIGKQVIKMDTTATLMICAAISCVLALTWGVKWNDIQVNMLDGIRSMGIPIIILMLVGVLVGTWMISGTIPTMMYYGMIILKPGMFLFLTCIICSLMSIMTGTSWGTISTIGVALVGVSLGLRIPIQYTVGAIVVGAYFGDKLSPLSDTTVLASAVCDVELTDHIKHMLYTTIPGYIISLVLYFILGLKYKSGVVGGEEYILILETLKSTFIINPLMLLPPIVVLFLIIKKKPTIPTFAVGIFAASILAIFIQGETVLSITNAMINGYTGATEVAIVDKLICRGGLNSMLGTVGLIFTAGLFGAPMKASGAIQVIFDKVENIAKTDKQFMVSVTIIHIVFYIVALSYYVTYAVLGEMARGLYSKYDLHKKNLSRTLEDTGTVLAPLIPWGISGAFIASNLGVTIGGFWIYAPMTYCSIIFGLILIATGYGIAKADGTMKKSFFIKNKNMVQINSVR